MDPGSRKRTASYRQRQKAAGLSVHSTWVTADELNFANAILDAARTLSQHQWSELQTAITAGVEIAADRQGDFVIDYTGHPAQAPKQDIPRYGHQECRCSGIACPRRALLSPASTALPLTVTHYPRATPCDPSSEPSCHVLPQSRPASDTTGVTHYTDDPLRYPHPETARPALPESSSVTDSPNVTHYSSNTDLTSKTDSSRHALPSAPLTEESSSPTTYARQGRYRNRQSRSGRHLLRRLTTEQEWLLLKLVLQAFIHDPELADKMRGRARYTGILPQRLTILSFDTPRI